MIFPQHAQDFKGFIESLHGKKVAICGHMRPDGDCIGSQVGLCRPLRTIGIDAVMVNQDPIPRNLQSFVGDTPFVRAEDFSPDGHIAINVDCADHKRVGEILRGYFPTVAMNIDHHVSNTAYGAHNIIEGHTAATAEILTGLLLDGAYPIDALTAQALYVGIATDTGQFRFPSTSPQVFELCSALIARGADPAGAAHELYERESRGRLALLQHFLASLKMECDGAVCLGSIDDSAYRETGADKEDTEGLVDYARSIDGVIIGALIEERHGAIKASLRAKDPNVRVDQIAKKFGGGGHACAAGLNVKSGLDAFYPQLVEALRLHLDALKQEGAL